MSCQAYGSSAGIGAFWGPSSARGAMFRGALVSRASEGQGGGSAQGLNRMGAGSGGGSGQLESIEGPGRCSGRCSGGQAEMGEDLGNHGGCSMAAMIFKVPPHWSSARWRFSDTRLRKPSLAFALRAGVRRSKPAPCRFVSSRAQLTRAGAAGGGTSAQSTEVLALPARSESCWDVAWR
jgi:hypothetical protein